MKAMMLLKYTLLVSFFALFVIYLSGDRGMVYAQTCDTGWYIGDQCCVEIQSFETCVEGVDWGYCGPCYDSSDGNEYCFLQQPANCSDVWSSNCCCNGTISLKCVPIPEVERLGLDNRIWGDSICGRTNATIDCNGILNNHHVCNSTYYPSDPKCAIMEPMINSYSVSKTSIIIGESFSTSVSGSCPIGLLGKCLIECKIVKPNGYFVYLNSWDSDGSLTLPSITCDQIGNYIVDYCGVFTDFHDNGGWGSLNDVNTTIICSPTPQCNNGIDDDSDGTCDWNGCPGKSKDLDCTDANDNTECGMVGTSCTQNISCCSGLICSSNSCKSLDSTPPTVTINSPGSGSWQKTNFTLTYSATDASIDKCNLSIKNGISSSWVYKGVIPCGSSQTIITAGSGKNCSVEGLNQCGVRIAANDTSGNNNIAERNFSIDYTNPTYSNENDDSQGLVSAGTKVIASVYWQDNINLYVAGFYNNESGVMKLNSTCYIASPSGWCNKTIDIIGQEGKKICWYQNATDNAGNMNNIMKDSVHCFNVISSSGEISQTVPQTSVEAIFESIRQSISSSSVEFSINIVTLAFELMGIIILVILLVIVVFQLVQSH